MLLCSCSAWRVYLHRARRQHIDPTPRATVFMLHAPCSMLHAPRSHARRAVIDHPLAKRSGRESPHGANKYSRRFSGRWARFGLWSRRRRIASHRLSYAPAISIALTCHTTTHARPLCWRSSNAVSLSQISSTPLPPAISSFSPAADFPPRPLLVALFLPRLRRPSAKATQGILAEAQHRIARD